MTSTSPPVSDSTRDRLVRAGLRIFGEYGYSGTSTRAIAAEAGANLAAIPYHFGGKEGLYLAVAEHIAERIGEFLLPAVGEAERTLQGDYDITTARDQLHRLVRRFAEMIVFNPDTELFAALIQREQARPTAAFEILYGNSMRRMSGVIDALVGRLIRRPPGDRQTVLLSTTIIGQVLVFRTSRAVVLRRLGWERFDDDKTPPIFATLQRNVDACIDAWRGGEP